MYAGPIIQIFLPSSDFLRLTHILSRLRSGYLRSADLLVDSRSRAILFRSEWLILSNDKSVYIPSKSPKRYRYFSCPPPRAECFSCSDIDSSCFLLPVFLFGFLDSLEYTRGFRISPATPLATSAATTSPPAATPAPTASRGRRTCFLFTFHHRRGRFNFQLLQQLPADFSDHNSVARRLTALRLPIASVAGYRAVPPPVLCP